MLNSILQWLDMGGYSGYIWSAYGVVCGVLFLNVMGCLMQQKRINKSLRLWFKQFLS